MCRCRESTQVQNSRPCGSVGHVGTLVLQHPPTGGLVLSPRATAGHDTSVYCLLHQVAHLEWFEPIFPGGHWTPQLIEMAGGQHPLNPGR